MICNRCKVAETKHEMCDQCLLKEAANVLNTASPTFSKTPRRNGNRGGYKHTSESLAVDPEQVEEQREVFKHHGVGDIEHTAEGCPIFTSEGQFQAATKALGMRTGRDGYDNVRRATGNEKHKRQEAVQKKWEALAPTPNTER